MKINISSTSCYTDIITSHLLSNQDTKISKVIDVTSNQVYKLSIDININLTRDSCYQTTIFLVKSHNVLPLPIDKKLFNGLRNLIHVFNYYQVSTNNISNALELNATHETTIHYIKDILNTFSGIWELE